MLTKADRLAGGALPGGTNCSVEQFGHHGASLAVHAEGRAGVAQKGRRDTSQKWTLGSRGQTHVLPIVAERTNKYLRNSVLFWFNTAKTTQNQTASSGSSLCSSRAGSLNNGSSEVV